MQKAEKLVILGAVSLAAYWFYSKSRALASMNFLPGTVTNFVMTGGSPVLMFNLIAQNTSTSSLQVNSIAANVYSGDTLIGNISNFTPVVIPGNAQALVPVSAQLQVIGIVDQLLNAFAYKNNSKKVQLRGSANVNGIQLPLDGIEFSIGL